MTQKEALEIMKMGYNVFLTGEPGTGKTYVLSKYIEFLRKKNIPIGVTASTGIAATHLDGVTIDSWSGLGIRDELSDSDLETLKHKFHLAQRLQKTKVLIIDEVSMISGKRLDLVDLILRNIRGKNLPFGGLQLILSGDLFQLPPVSTDRNKIDFLFSSKAWRNIDVDAINSQELEKLEGEQHEFNMIALGNEKLTTVLKNTCLAPEVLKMKKKALVMFVRNNYSDGYVNGSMGKVKGFDNNGDPVVELFSGKKVTVAPTHWTIMDGNKIIAQITQIPLRLAWAITVHKSQGMTLDVAELDLSKSFLLGMGYVALSRVRSLSGLRLLGLNEIALKVNPQVSAFDKYLLELSSGTAINLRKIGFLRSW